MTWAKNLHTLQTNVDSGQGGTPQKSEWDYVILGGYICPGIARVTVKVGSGLDVQKPKGNKGATITDNGDPPLGVTIEIELQPDEFGTFVQYILPTLRPPGRNGGRAPLKVGHPLLAAVNIDSIVVGPFDLKQPKSGETMKISLDCHQHMDAPRPVKVKKKIQDGVAARLPSPDEIDSATGLPKYAVDPDKQDAPVLIDPYTNQPRAPLADNAFK